MRKQCIFYTPAYLYKFIKKKYEISDSTLYIPSTLELHDPMNDFKNHINYFNDKKGKVTLKVVMVYPTKRRLFRLYLHLVELFRFELINWMNMNFENGFQAKKSLEEFLLYYNISEEEYKFDRGYKVWQRYKMRQRQEIEV